MMKDDFETDVPHPPYSVRTATTQTPVQKDVGHNCASTPNFNFGRITSSQTPSFDHSWDSRRCDMTVNAPHFTILNPYSVPESSQIPYASRNNLMEDVHKSAAFPAHCVNRTSHLGNAPLHRFEQPVENECQSLKPPPTKLLSFSQPVQLSDMANKNATDDILDQVADGSTTGYPSAVSLMDHAHRLGVGSPHSRANTGTALFDAAEANSMEREKEQKFSPEKFCSLEQLEAGAEEDLKSMYPQLFLPFSDAVVQAVSRESMTAGKWSFVFCLKLLTTSHQPRLVEWIDRPRLLFQVSEGRTKNFITLWAHKDQVVRGKQLKGTWDNFTARIRYKSNSANTMYFDFEYKENPTDVRFKDMPKKRVFKFAEAFRPLIDRLDPPKSNLVLQHQGHNECLVGRSLYNKQRCRSSDESIVPPSGHTPAAHLPVTEEDRGLDLTSFPTPLSNEAEATVGSVPDYCQYLNTGMYHHPEVTNDTLSNPINSARSGSAVRVSKETQQTSDSHGFAMNAGFHNFPQTPLSVKLASASDQRNLVKDETSTGSGQIPFNHNVYQTSVEGLIPRTISHSDSDSDSHLELNLEFQKT